MYLLLDKLSVKHKNFSKIFMDQIIKNEYVFPILHYYIDNNGNKIITIKGGLPNCSHNWSYTLSPYDKILDYDPRVNKVEDEIDNLFTI